MYENAVIKPLWLNVLQRFYVLQHVFEHCAFSGVPPVLRLLKNVFNLSGSSSLFCRTGSGGGG